MNAFILLKPESVRLAADAENVATYNKAPIRDRRYCSKCGGPLMTDHPTIGVVDVLSPTLPTLIFNPWLHLNYAKAVLSMKDGLPRFKDIPRAFGG